jgi:hypothetical protein
MGPLAPSGKMSRSENMGYNVMEFKTIQKIVYQNVPTLLSKRQIVISCAGGLQIVTSGNPHSICDLITTGYLPIHMNLNVISPEVFKYTEDYTKSHLQCTTVLPILKNSHFLYIIKSYIMSHHGLSPSHALCF